MAEARDHLGSLSPLILVVLLVCYCRHGHCALTALSVVGKDAWQSTTFRDKYAWRANDGRADTYSHTRAGDPHPWWLVDLGGQHCLEQVTVTLRRHDGFEHGFRFIAGVLRAGLSSNYTENMPCGSPAMREQSWAGAMIPFLCDTPRMARYISLDIDPASQSVQEAILQIAEVTAEEWTDRWVCTDTATFKRMFKGALSSVPEPIISTKEARSLAQCASYCSMQPGCASFDFTPGSRVCRLYCLAPNYMEITPSQECSVYGLVN